MPGAAAKLGRDACWLLTCPPRWQRCFPGGWRCVPLQQDPVVGEKLMLSLFPLLQGGKLHPLSAGGRYRASGCLLEAGQLTSLL